MAKDIATPKVTAGGGFSFEDKTVAYLLACLLTDKPPFDSHLGTIERLDLQVRVDGWHLDDVLITLDANGVRRRCAISVKSNQQFTKDNAPQEFVTAAWEIFLDPGKMNFDRTRDLLGIATTPLDPELHRQLHELLVWARDQQIGDLPIRVAEKGYGSEPKRTLLASLACPANLAATHQRTEAGTSDMLKCMQHLTFDFELTPSDSLAKAISYCREALRNGELVEAQSLWDALCALARDNRSASGSIDITRLLDLIRNRFRLKSYPQFTLDWASLAEFTNDNIGRIPDLIGGTTVLSRSAEEEAFKSSTSVFTALIGPSGCGKTVLAKKIVQSKSEYQEAIWINAASLDTPDFRGFESTLNLQHTLSELFDSYSGQSAVLVIDGLDRQFKDNVFANAATLLKKIGMTRENTPWRVILPSQPIEWNGVDLSLAKANFRVQWTTFDLREPTDLQPVWDAFPELRSLALRPELAPILLNLNILDIVATRIDSIDPSRWTGESDLIEWLWNSEIEKLPHAALRAAFVSELGKIQGDEMRTEVPLNKFGIADQMVVDELVSDRICSKREGKITFHHDRLGDWARQRILLSEIDDLAKYQETRFLSPSWHPAVRLLGLHLLEQSTTIDRWLALFLKCGSPDKTKPTFLQDLLLESVIFAASPDILLDRLLPQLTKDGGMWLKRLLVRFRHVATLPNPLVTQLPNVSVIEAATFMRIPYGPYWLAVIKFINTHRDLILDIAPHEISLIVDDWLRWGGANWPLRNEAAGMGLTLGKKTLDLLRQTNSNYLNDKDLRTPFRAALAGAKEFPDDVAAFALDAAERTTVGRNRPTQPATRSRFAIADESYPPPWPDGPLSRVTKAFATEVLESDALRALIFARPEIAREVLFACLIEEPRLSSPFVDRSSLRRQYLNIDHLHNWFPPFFSRGPFILFLRINATEGLEVVLRLVNFAFERWVEGMREQGQPVSSVTVTLGGGDRVLIGGYDAYSAYTDTSQWPYPMVSALMALEKWFYDQIDSNQAIDSTIQVILQRTTNVAFIGLLNIVGCKQPSLFSGPLKPLLSIAEFHDWELIRQRQAHPGLAAMGWGFKPLAASAKEWHTLPHRQKTMHDEAWSMMLQEPETRPHFRAMADGWDIRRATETDQYMARFLRTLAPKFRIENNFRTVHPQQGPVVYYKEPEEISAEFEESRQTSSQHVHLISFPYHCSELLEKKAPIPDEELDGFWTSLQRVAEIKATLPEDDADLCRAEDSVCGGIAVLFTLHRAWLTDHSEKEKWCVEKLLKILLDPPTGNQIEYHRADSDWNWRSFGARVIAILWSEEPNGAEVRRFVASLAVSRTYKPVAVLCSTASAYRGQLGDAFKELQEFIFDWAIERSRHEREQYDENPYQVGSWLDAQIDAFSTGQRARRVSPWIFPETMTAALLEGDPNVENPIPYPEIDLELIKAAYSWLPSLEEARNDTERADWISFWKYAQSMSLFVVNKDTIGRGNNDATPYDWDRWVLSNIASLILQLDLPEDRREFWKPWLDLGCKAHYWVENFIADYLEAGLIPDDVPQRFVDVWRSMIEYVHDSGIWNQDATSNHYADHLWVHLLGLESFHFWTADRAMILTQMQDKFEQWAAEQLTKPESAAVFGLLLATPAAERLLPDGIAWLDKADLPLNRSTRYGRLDAICSDLLASSWLKRSHLIRREPTFTAFKRILTKITELQNPIALELMDQMRK